MPSLPTFISIVSLSIFAVTFALILLIRRYWTFCAGSDEADGVRKVQDTPILRIGGLAIAGAFVACIYASTLLPETSHNHSVGMTFALLGLALFLVGFADDLYGISALIKLGVQIIVGVGAYLAGMRIDLISFPMGDGSIDLQGFGLIITVIWFVAIPNLINLIDGMDGLAGGVGLFLSLTLGGIGLFSGNPFLATMGLGFAAGLAAFLFFNFPPAKIYMGDGGAYLIGYFIAATSLITANKGSITGPLLVVMLGLGFPILDTGLSIVRRALSGMPVMGADARHLHHRLMTLGFSKRTILLVLYGVFAALAVLGLAIFILQGYAIPVAAMILLVGLFAGLKFVGLPHNFAEAKMLFHDMIAARKDVRYAYAMSQVLLHDLERVPDAESYWNELRSFLSKLGIKPATEQLGKWRCDKDCNCIILFPISKDQVWHLCCPEPKLRRRQWDRVIRCFHLAVMNGIEKWDSAPEDLSIRPFDPEKCPKESEDEINHRLLNGEARSASSASL